MIMMKKVRKRTKMIQLTTNVIVEWAALCEDHYSYQN